MKTANFIFQLQTEIDTFAYKIQNIAMHMNLRGTDRSTALDRLLPRRTVFSRAKVKIYDFLLKN